MEEPIFNKVANSGLISLDLEEFYSPGERVILDLKDNLYQGIVLKEQDFRAFIKNHDWTIYDNKNVAILCTADAIVPTWAYMLLAVNLEGHANHFVFGSIEELEISLFNKAIQNLDLEPYKNAKIVIKGCSKINVPIAAYVEISRVLKPIASSIMFGEPCSTVPIYKPKKNKPL